MGKEKSKKTNVVLYTLLMIFVFVFITEGIIYGYGGNLVFHSIVNYPQGNLVIGEAVLAIMVLIVMLIFKNSYVFTQKKEALKTGLFYGLFYLIGAGFFSLIYAGGFKSGLTLINIFLGCILIGICEEFLCRGWLLNEFLERYGNTKKGVWYSIIISGLIFGLMHISNIFTMGQAVSATITQVLNAAGLGIIFGLIYYKTKNIWSVVILHAVWDFSLFLGTVMPITEQVEMITSFSFIGILFNVLLVGAQLLNIVPYINDIDAKPSKKTVILLAIVSFILYFVFMIISGLSSSTFGDTYKYGNITLDSYAITRDNYVEYKIDYVLDNFVENKYSFTLLTNEDNNLIFRNNITKDYIEFECEDLYDYIIIENNNNFIISYLDYTDSANAFLNYIYINKFNLSNDTQYLNSIKNNMKKYLLPSVAELLVVHDYDNNKSYLSAYHVDYGYYLLVNENEVSLLNS